MYTKEYYIEQLEDLGIDPRAYGLTDGLESATLETLKDILERAEREEYVLETELPDTVYDPQDQLENGRFSWR